MVFSSVTFLFLFLPLVITGYYLLPWRLKNFWLLLASTLFIFWGSGKAVAIVAVSILGNWLFGLALSRAKSQRARKLVLAGSVIFSLGLLGYFKYFNFLIETLNSALTHLSLSQLSFAQVALPIGISFYSFHAMSYVIDLYRGRVEVQRNLLDFGLYILFFPQLIAGPIVRYIDIAEQYKRREHTAAGFLIGCRRFIIGLAKKVLIANTLAEVADRIFALTPHEFTPAASWLAILCYTGQIYFDFSGYSDMAIGLSRMFGFRLLENFNYPYISNSITEFWRRWHISLSTWFRDFLYIPLGGNRGTPARTYLNLWIVFVLCGFWHGAAWNFLIWGVFHGTLLVCERLLRDRPLFKPAPFLQHIYTMFFVIIGWVLFRSESLGYAVNFMRNMFGALSVQPDALNLSQCLNPEVSVTLILAVIFSMPVVGWLQNLSLRAQAGTTAQLSLAQRLFSGLYVSAEFAVVTMLYFISLFRVSASGYNPFIYFRF